MGQVGQEMHTEFLWENLNGYDSFEDLGVGGNILNGTSEK